MLIEQSAYANRWRKVTPAAKGFFALSGFVAAFAASTPAAALLVAVVVAATTIAGADGSRQVSQNELDGARYQGRKIAETAAKLTA